MGAIAGMHMPFTAIFVNQQNNSTMISPTKKRLEYTVKHKITKNKDKRKKLK